ncbi:MAG: 16S rRNA (cytosine(1402)-N(4))-methyltransferase RsmH [Phycisphaerales bacterium]
MGSDPEEGDSATEGVGHEPVLLAEVLAALDLRPGDTAADLTLGRGGHALPILEAVGVSGRLVGFDRDAENLAFAGRRLAAHAAVAAPPIEVIRPPDTSPPGPLRLIHADFAHAGEALRARSIAADAVLADLGVASTHFDDPARGFSFRFEGPLDMRLDRSRGATAAELLASLPEDELARMIRLLGEEPLAARIARKIACVRESAPISTTSELAELVRAAYGPRAHRSRMHPATRTFMALRIAVNDELGSLQRLLASIEEAAAAIGRGEASWLRPGARVAVISFHSLEDRAVKWSFASLAERGLVRLMGRRPAEASASEQDSNPRSRSAKLRVATVGAPSNPPSLESAWMPVHDA